MEYSLKVSEEIRKINCYIKKLILLAWTWTFSFDAKVESLLFAHRIALAYLKCFLPFMVDDRIIYIFSCIYSFLGISSPPAPLYWLDWKISDNSFFFHLIALFDHSTGHISHRTFLVLEKHLDLALEG